MTQPDDQTTERADAPPGQTKPKGRKRKFVAWVVLVAGLICLAGFAFGVSMLGQTVKAPDWVLDRFEDRASDVLSGGSLDVSDASLVVSKELVPKVQFRDVVLRDANNRVLAELANVQATVSRSAALRGELELRKLDLSGLLIKLNRNADGAFVLAFGDTSVRQDQALSLGELVHQFEDILDRPQFATLTGVDVQGATLDYTDVQAGRRWLADGGRLSLVPSDEAIRLRTDFAVLTGATDVTTIEASIDVPRRSDAVSIGIKIDDVPARDIALQSPALTWLSVLDAPLSASMRFDVGSDGALGPLFGKLEIAEGALAPETGIRPIPFSSARAYFNYDPAQGIVRFDEVAVESDTLTAQATGHAYLRDIQAGAPSSLLGQFQFSELQGNPDEVYETPISLGPAMLDMRLRLDPFRVDIGQFVLSPEGAPVVLNGVVTADTEAWGVAINAKLGQSSIAAALPLWPPLLAQPTRNWLAQNVIASSIPSAELAFRLRGDEKPAFAMTVPFENSTVRFMKTMPPVEDAKGYVTMVENALTVMVDGGTVQARQGGRIDVTGTSFQLPKLGGKSPQADVRLKTKGTATATLSILDRDPLNFISKANQPIDLLDGQIEAETRLGFRLQKNINPKDITFTASGTATSLRTTKLVPGRTISAQKLRVDVTKDQLQIAGNVRFGGVPATGTWTQPLGTNGQAAASVVQAEVELSPAFLREFKVALPDGAVQGAAKGDLTVTLARGAPAQFDLKSDLRGATLRLRDLGWTKPANGKGRLRIKGALGSPPSLEQLELESAGLNLSGNVVLNPNGTLKTARFDKVRVGQWLNAPVTLTGRGRNATPAISVRGGTADLSKTEFGKGGGTGQGGPLDLRLDSVQITDGIRLTNFKGTFSGQGAFNGKFSGNVNDGTQVNGTLAPSSNGTAIRLQSDDAGRLLKSAKLLRNARGGSFDLTLQPTGAEGTYDGKLKVEETRIQNAPTLAQLLSAVSIIGLLDQMTESGILFGQVDAEFRLSPNRVILSKGSAVGPSMGISMDGIYNLGNGKMDMQGVLSPLYAVNGIGQIFTRKGEGLLGFNFNLKGTADKPKVQVNPLSIFTPGMFREIFRRPPPKLQ